MRFLLALVPVCLLAQSGLQPPDLGLMLDQRGSLRPVSGAAGSFVLREPRTARVLSFSCSQSTCVAKTRDSLITAGATIPAPPGPAVIAAENSGATLYFAQSRQFAQLRDGALQPLEWAVDGELLSMVSIGAAMPGGFKLAVKRDTGIWITAQDGSILDSLPPSDAVLLLPDAAVYATANELVVRRADGAEMRFECPGVRELFAMTNGWVEARSRSGVFALRTDAGQEYLYLLPQPYAAGTTTCPASAGTQLTLLAVNPDGSTGIQIGASYSLGSVAAGDTAEFRFRVCNQGTVSVTVVPAISGMGFTIVSPQSSYNLAPQNSLDIYVDFEEPQTGSYKASFQVNSISTILTATVVAAATLSVHSPCTGPDATTRAINFGSTQSGGTVVCVVSLQNTGAQSLMVSSISLGGQGFQFSQVIQTPVVLPAGGSFSFTVAFAPGSGGAFSGTLTVDAQSYPLSGTAYIPSLPTPQIQFDAGAPSSGQQRIVTMSLPTPSPVSSSGTLQLSFKPGISVVTDDPAVVFTANGTRGMPFTIKGGDTQFLLQGQSGAVFQTGTTWGTISFSASVNGPVAGTATASMAIPATPLAVDHAIATSRSGDLDVQVWGYDNTYSAGGMSFTFYDLNGNVIQPGAVQADFTPQFRTYFTTANAGSAFQMRVSFPVTGDSSQILAVDVALSNSAGTTTIQHLDFQCAGGTCPVTSQ